MRLSALFRLLLAPILFSASALWAGPAFPALEVVRSQRGPEFLAKLVEMRGERGEPQPLAWKLFFNDPEARGGVRELVVQGANITSERTPLRGMGGVGDLPVLTMANIKLDSTGAFAAANREALRMKVGFHWIDYTLRADANNGQPIWVVDLTDYLGIRVGSLVVAADSGRVVRPLVLEPGTPTEQATVNTPFRQPSRPRGGAIGRVENFGRNVGETLHRGTLNVFGVAEEWLTGERTIGLEED